jgi:hypothetical protein
VNTPAAEHGVSLTKTATSGAFDSFNPADADPARKPRGDVTLPSGSVANGCTAAT